LATKSERKNAHHCCNSHTRLRRTPRSPIDKPKRSGPRYVGIRALPRLSTRIDENVDTPWRVERNAAGHRIDPKLD
jgi:hypothetical protein